MFNIYTKFTIALNASKALALVQVALNHRFHDIRCRATGLLSLDTKSWKLYITIHTEMIK